MSPCIIDKQKTAIYAFVFDLHDRDRYLPGIEGTEKIHSTKALDVAKLDQF